MSKKRQFISLVEKLFEDSDLYEYQSETLNVEDAIAYFTGFKETKEVEKPLFTENGKNILVYMQKNKEEKNNLFKASDIGEGLFVSSRSVSGAIRKLVTDGYVEKIGETPITYTLTKQGEDYIFIA